MLRSEKGVGLVEIIIAMLIFAIGITAALRTLPDSNRATSRSRNLSTATNIAQQKIEELMGATFNDADLTAGTHVDADNPIEAVYIRTWSVRDDMPLPDMKRVDVTVQIRSGNSDDNTVTLTTYLTSRR